MHPPPQDSGAGGETADDSAQSSEAVNNIESVTDREGDTRVVVHLYSQPPARNGGFPYWTEDGDEKLLRY